MRPSELFSAACKVDDALEGLDGYARLLDDDHRAGDAAQAVLMVGEAVVLAIRELGLRLEAMSS